MRRQRRFDPERTPLLAAIGAHCGALRFHMPGHKNGKRFRRTFGKCADFDVTELDYSDNLQSPAGAIAASEARVAARYGAQRCLYSVQGSTLSAFCALSAAKAQGAGRKVLLSRDTHKSFWAACEVLGLDPVAVPPERFGEVCDKDVCAAVYTFPDYFGERGKIDFDLPCKIVADCAHGAHLILDRMSGLGEICRRADFTLLSAHKFLPSFTQSAFLLVNGAENALRAGEARNLFGTTSPSYLLMCGIEYGVEFLFERGAAEMKRLARASEKFLPDLRVQGDPLRLILRSADFGMSGRAAEKALALRGIRAECADGERVLFLLGLETRTRDLKRLGREIRRLRASGGAQGTSQPMKELPEEIALGWSEAVRRPAELVELSACAGRICARNLGFYPPATVFVLAGERISEEKARALRKEREYVYGLIGGKVPVIGGEEEK